MIGRFFYAAVALLFLLGSSQTISSEVPKVIFTEDGIYLSSNPNEQAKIGESLSLKNLGRRFPSCRVFSEYSQGDEETIETMVTCDQVAVSVDFNESGKIVGFWTTTTGASFLNGVQVADSLVEATGSTAYCNLCNEDEMPYCKSEQTSRVRYDIEYNECLPINVEIRRSCWGKHQIARCTIVQGLGLESTDEGF